MPGPLPKPDEARRRRNTEGTGKARQLERRTGPAPELGRRRGDLEWDDEILGWWPLAWRSQMASLWHEAEEQLVRRYCDLWQTWLDLLDGDRVWSIASRAAGPDAVRVLISVDPASSTLLAGMKDLEERLGLSPQSRRRMNIEVAAESEQKTPAARRRRVNDPRLTVVRGGRAKGSDKSPPKAR